MTHDATTAPVSSPAAAPDALARRDERGSALIISMMIMVILTMLGVTFAVLAEQEQKISINSRDHVQTLYAAEAAVELAKTWFNDPGATNALKPPTAQVQRTLRKGATFDVEDYYNEDERANIDLVSHSHDSVNGSLGSIYTGGNLGGSSALFDKPYRGPFSYGLWGRQATPDAVICADATLNVDGLGGANECLATGASGFIAKLNRSLSMGTTLRNAPNNHSSRDLGVVEIEQIRVYRPPIDFDIKTRFGIATIEATAVKRARNQIVARRTVREVLQEIPFPGPNGAIETEGEISSAGSSGVHWGAVVSSSLDDDINLPNTSGNFPDAPVARSASSRFGYHYSINPAAYAQPAGAPGGHVTTFLTEALNITKNGQNISSGWAVGTNYQQVRIGDPWLYYRARRNIVISGGPNNPGVSTPFPYTVGSGAPAGILPINNNNNPEFNNKSSKNWSHMFQNQIVRFPPIDYETWKDVAMSGQQGMYYFKWVNGVNYQRDGRGPTQTFEQWLQQYDTGVFFFDTTDATKPKDICATNPNDANCNLTPVHGWGQNLYISGFIYLNTKTFDSSGAGGGTTVACNSPGEPFLDDGIDLHQAGETEGDGCLCIRFTEDQGCVLGVRPIGFATSDTGYACPGAIDGDDCTCSQPVLTNTVNATAATRAVARREADTFRNGVWDSDIDNDGITDAGEDLTTLSGWSRFIQNNDGATAQDGVGGLGYARGVLPRYPYTRRANQGADRTGTTKDFMRDPRFLNDIDTLGGNPSQWRQVHEPFVNLDSLLTNGNTIGTWSGNSHHVAVDFRADGEVVERNAGGAAVKSTTRARDATGPLINLDLHINGVFYCEGQYTGTGNLKVYGSLLMRGGYSGTGSVDVWFNEDLIKGRFPPATWRLPRVYSSARDTN